MKESIAWKIVARARQISASHSSFSSHPSDAIEKRPNDFLPVTAAPDPAFRWGCVATGGGEGGFLLVGGKR